MSGIGVRSIIYLIVFIGFQRFSSTTRPLPSELVIVYELDQGFGRHRPDEVIGEKFTHPDRGVEGALHIGMRSRKYARASRVRRGVVEEAFDLYQYMVFIKYPAD